MPEDEELLNTINEGSGTTSEGEKKPKKKKEERGSVEPSNAADRLDPRDEFIAILNDIGIKRGVGVITDVFFNGDISSPVYLDEILALGGIAIPQRKLIITRYFGQSPEDMGVEMVTTKQAKQGANRSKDDNRNSDIGITATEMLKERMQTAQTMAMLKQFDKMNDDGDKGLPQKTVERPLIDTETGDFVVRDGKPVMERITTIGEVGSSSDPMTMALAMVNMMGKKSDSNDRPSWAVDLQNSVVTSQAENEKRRLEDELRRERDKREDEEKEHKREMERIREDTTREMSHVKDNHVEEMKRISDEMLFRMDNIKDNFGAEIRHREEMDTLKEVYGGEFGKLRDELDVMNKDIKSAVVGEAVKTGSKVVGKSTETLDTVIGGAADVLKDLYKAQIEAARGNVGGAGISMPDTTEDELKKLM